MVYYVVISLKQHRRYDLLFFPYSPANGRTKENLVEVLKKEAIMQRSPMSTVDMIHSKSVT